MTRQDLVNQDMFTICEVFPMQNVPEKRYRLEDGSRGTEREALTELLRRLEAKMRYLEEEIEITRKRLETAEGGD